MWHIQSYLRQGALTKLKKTHGCNTPIQYYTQKKTAQDIKHKSEQKDHMKHPYMPQQISLP